jgi:hypothetical protein
MTSREERSGLTEAEAAHYANPEAVARVENALESARAGKVGALEKWADEVDPSSLSLAHHLIVDHPNDPSMWRHEPPMWESCMVCGHPTCWVELDIGFKHHECDAYPSEEGDVMIVLGLRVPRAT